MRRRVFSLGRTDVYLHLATLGFAAYMILIQQGTVFLVALVSIIVHECAHALISALLGRPPEEIELTPLGAMMRLETDQMFTRSGRMLMLAAGPAASLGLCWLAIAMTKAGLLSVHTGRLVFTTNLLFLAGNMLPALPMDGGRMLALLLSLRMRTGTVKRILRVSGTCTGLMLIGLNLYISLSEGSWNLSLSASGCFLMYTAVKCSSSTAMEELRSFMDRRIRMESRGSLGCQCIAVKPDTSSRRAVKLLAPCRYTLFLCVDPAGVKKPVRFIGEGTLIEAYLRSPASCVGEICDAKAPELH